MKTKIVIIILLGGLAATGCSKKKCVCTETMANHDRDIANQTVGSDTKRAVYTYKIGEKAMKPDGSSIEYTKAYIEQQKSELEATGKFKCEWKY